MKATRVADRQYLNSHISNMENRLPKDCVSIKESAIGMVIIWSFFALSLAGGIAKRGDQNEQPYTFILIGAVFIFAIAASVFMIYNLVRQRQLAQRAFEQLKLERTGRSASPGLSKNNLSSNSL